MAPITIDSICVSFVGRRGLFSATPFSQYNHFGGSDRLRSDLKRVGCAEVRSVCNANRPKIYDERCLAQLSIGLRLGIKRLLAARP